MIRFLVVFLLIANLVLAFVIYQQGSQQSPGEQTPEVGGNLQLLSEVDGKVLAALKPVIVVPELAVQKVPPAEEIQKEKKNATACYRYGPLSSYTSAKKLMQTLQEQKIEVVLDEQKKEPVSRFFVVLDTSVHSQPNDPHLLEQMKPLGLEEVWRIRSGTLKGEYSLGMFSKKPYAASLVSQLAALGVSAKEIERKLEISQYWLDFSLPAEQDAAALFPKELSGEVESRTCTQE